MDPEKLPKFLDLIVNIFESEFPSTETMLALKSMGHGNINAWLTFV